MINHLIEMIYAGAWVAAVLLGIYKLLCFLLGAS